MAVPYQRLAARLQHLIESGAWPPGYRIPSHAQLQAQYGVGRGVVEHAIAQLRRAGLIEGERRTRPRVAYRPAVRTLINADADWPLPPDARRHTGRPYASEELAARLGVPVGTRLHMEAVELVDAGGVTVGACTTWRRGRPRVHVSFRCEIRMHAITAAEAELTGLTMGASAWLVERTRYDAAGAPVEVADLVLPSDRWRLSM